MNRKTFANLATLIFLIVAVVHLTRALLEWEIVIADWMMPTWFSWLGFIFASFMAYSGFSLSKGS